MVFHLLGLAHVQTIKENSTCAYTQKIIKLAKILKNNGHKVNFYGCKGSEIEADNIYEVITKEDIEKQYGAYDNKKEFYKQNSSDDLHKLFNTKTSEIINSIKNKDDILLCPMGLEHKIIADNVKLLPIESGIGYTGIFSNYKVFESYSWMHYIYGLNNIGDGVWTDSIIPNYFDLSDFYYKKEKKNYILYFGRIIKRKGVELVSQIAEKTGNELWMVGQGELKDQWFDISNKDFIKHKNAVGPEERKEILSNAKLVIMPTYYLEPFGGVAVEAMLSGTPVVTTDWGAFPETIVHGKTGYRCRSFEQFIWAVNNIHYISSEDCRIWAESNYSLDRVGRMYEEYFNYVYNIHYNKEGWYKEKKDRENMEWLEKYYPI